MPTSALGDWTEDTIREALEKSLNDKRLAQFNQHIKALLETEIHADVLKSSPLELVPILLLADEAISNNPHDVQQTLELIAQYGSAKEVLLVVQEFLDGLVQQTGDLEDTDAPSHVIWKLNRLIDMYRLAFPRLVLRKRSALDMATPIIQQLRQSFNQLASLIDRNSSEAKNIVIGCERLGHALLGWFHAVHENKAAISDCKLLLKDLLFITVAQCLSDEDIMKAHDDFLFHLRETGLAFASDYDPSGREKLTAITRSHTQGRFVNFYLSPRGPVRPKGTRAALKAQLDGFTLCLQQPWWRRTALGFINDCILGGLYDDQPLEEDIAIEIVPTVSSCASTDPNPKNRAEVFRLLVRLVLKTQPMVAFRLVRDLASEECPFQNMRASAVGLLRQLVVRAFSSTPPLTDDPFVTRLLLQEYTSIVFRSSILKEGNGKLLAPTDTQELNRIIEALGFYHVLLGRDLNNLTGVRDPEVIREMRKSFLLPLRTLINEPESTREDPSTLLALRSAGIALERVEESLAGLQD